MLQIACLPLGEGACTWGASRDLFLASRNGLFFKLSLPYGALVMSFFLFLSSSCSPCHMPRTFSGLAGPQWKLLRLTCSRYPAHPVPRVSKFLCRHPGLCLPGPQGSALPPATPPPPLPSTGSVPVFGLRWSWLGSKKELFLSPCIVLSPIPKMGSGLGGPPNPQLQARREGGRTWQSLEKGGGPNITLPPPAPGLAPWSIKIGSLWDVLRLLHVLRGPWGGAGLSESEKEGQHVWAPTSCLKEDWG